MPLENVESLVPTDTSPVARVFKVLSPSSRRLFPALVVVYVSGSRGNFKCFASVAAKEQR